MVTFGDWPSIGNEVIAHRRVSQSITLTVPSAVLRAEDTTFELRHTPVRERASIDKE